MTKHKEKIEKDLRLLIKSVTAFDESDENFKLCVSFADSNFKYHRYLSPDSHKIHRAVEGLCEKFEVHSQKQKATDLKELTALFLEQPGLDGKDYGKTDVHYALLSLLLILAESPTKVDFKRHQKETVKEKVDNFDWKRYLLDDEDLNIVSFASSDSEDDEESLPDTYDGGDSEGDAVENGQTLSQDIGRELVGRLGESVDTVQQGVLAVGQQHTSAAGLGIGTSDEYEQLAAALTVEYWKGKGREEETAGSHAACNLARNWNFYQSKMNEFYTARARSVVTEHQVIRETLWMLSGSTELFIFKYDGTDYRLNPDVYLMHLTTESLESSLKPMITTAAQLVKLQVFVSDIVSQVCSSASTSDGSCVPQTYQAFASCVARFLQDFRTELRNREKAVMNQDSIQTLAKLASDLQLWFAKVQAVHGIYMSGIASVWSLIESSNSITANNCVKASLLLDILYQAVFESDLTSLWDDEEKSSFLLNLLLKSSEPIIQIISDWINKGQLRDAAGEFIVQRNKKIPLLNETFWGKAFVPSIQLPKEVSNLDVTSQKSTNHEISNTSSSKKLANQSTCNKTSDQAGNTKLPQDQSDFCWKHGPRFLQPVLGDVVLTGKSMEMLENLGRLGEVWDMNCGVYEKPPSLYELFVKDLTLKLGPKPEVDVSNSATDSLTDKSCGRLAEVLSSSPDPVIDKLLNTHGEKDTLMAINFSALFHESIGSKTPAQNRQTDNELPVLVNSDLSPLLKLCEACLYPYVRSRYKTVCAKLVHILETEYHLMDCIHAMQRYYLMSSGEIMCDFYTPIFQKIANKEIWRNSSMLELYLHEAVAPRFPEDVSKLTVTVTSDPTQKDSRPISMTDSIQLKYKVPWPVNVVVSGRCQELYYDIFTFLLQIKRAKYSVDQLRFEDLSCQQAEPKKDPFSDPVDEQLSNETRIHRCHLLRFRLLYFVNSLHNYIMTRILHSTGLEFASRLKEAADLEQIIRIHRQYAEDIHKRCLLQPNLAFLKKAVVSVLNLSLTFSTLWRQGLQCVSEDSIQEMETELSRCIQFLSAFLNNVIKRGSFPHLESLAFALVSSLKSSKR